MMCDISGSELLPVRQGPTAAYVRTAINDGSPCSALAAIAWKFGQLQAVQRRPRPA
jgi:hypothetical protein